MSRGAGGLIGLQSGKVGGVVLKQREGKQLITEFFKPQNPQTARQMEVRSINTELSRQWRDELNQGQRTAWNQRAEGIPGLRGETLYIRQNFPLLDFGLEKQMTPPPMVAPPELTDLTLGVATGQLELTVPQMVAGIITAQAPFIDIEVAGGFLVAVLTDNAVYTAEIESQMLSQGRIHQQSDFKHVIYLADKPIVNGPDLSEIIVSLPFGTEVGTTRNCVVRAKRYNKFGNVSGELIFNKIITQE